MKYDLAALNAMTKSTDQTINSDVLHCCDVIGSVCAGAQMSNDNGGLIL